MPSDDGCGAMHGPRSSHTAWWLVPVRAGQWSPPDRKQLTAGLR